MMDEIFRKISVMRKELLLFVLVLTLPLCMAVVAIIEFMRRDIGSFVVSTFTSIFFGLFCLGYSNLFRRNRTKLPQEIGRRELYSEDCGARLGFRNYTWPLARITIYYEMLVVRAYEEAIIYPKDIWNLEIIPAIAFGGIRIHHLRQDLPLWIIIWTWNPTLLKENIETDLHLKDMPQYGKQPLLEGMAIEEKNERQKYPWLQ